MYHSFTGKYSDTVTPFSTFALKYQRLHTTVTSATNYRWNSVFRFKNLRTRGDKLKMLRLKYI